jgi:hypothetical protein
MAKDKKPLRWTVLMGYFLGRLKQCENDSPETVGIHLENLYGLLCADDKNGWARVIEKLDDIHEAIKRSAVTSAKNGTLTHTVYKRIDSLVDDLLERTTGDDNNDFFIVLNDNEVIDKLASLKRVKGSDRDMMIREVVRCLESGASRAAIVIAWCLTFDHVRSWIFSSKENRLKAFNDVLITKNRTKDKLHDPIVDYEDFNEHDERYILTTAYEAKLFVKRHNQVLVTALTDRNHFAHANSRGATLNSALGYVDNLLLNVLTHPDFAFAIRKRKN